MFEIQVNDHLKETFDHIEASFELAIENLTSEIARRARKRVKRNSGKLMQSIGVDKVAKGGIAHEGDRETSWVGGVFADAEHAAATEFGSAGRGEPYAAAPDGWGQGEPPEKQTHKPYYNSYYHRNFDIPKHGGRYKGKHPGVKPQPFMRPAINDVCLRGEEATRIFEDAFANAYKKSRASGSGGSTRA